MVIPKQPVPATWATRSFGRGGLRVGALALGGAPLGNLGRMVTHEEWRDAVPAAWETGVRYFDVAPHYGLGLAERRMGETLATLPRDEFIVSTKVGRLLMASPEDSPGMDTDGYAVPATSVRVRDYSREGVCRSLESSLQRLGLSRVDILFVHDPDEYRDEALRGAFPALEELRAQGAIASYGAGMNQSRMLTEFIERTDLDIVMVAGRYTLLDQSALDDLLPTAERHGVSVVAAGVFNSGLLARDRPRQAATYDYVEASAELVQRANRIADIAERYGVTLPAVAAQFPLGHRAVATVCLGARSAEQARRNAALFTMPIPAALWSDLVGAGLLRADAPTPRSVP